MFKQSKKIERLNSIRAALALVIWFSVAPAHAVPRHPCIAANEGGLYQPTVGAVIGTFGMRMNPLTRETMFHSGIDYAVRAGDAVMAAGLGRVKVRAQDGPGDFHVVIDHGLGTEVLYAHLAETALIPGRCVNELDAVGVAGSRYPVEGGHNLHVEVRKHGALVDPLRVLKPRGFRALRR